MPWACPLCKTGELHVFDVPVQIRIASDGEIDDVVGGLKLRSSDTAECLGCGWRGTAGDCSVNERQTA
jgi:hypothetical protein